MYLLYLATRKIIPASVSITGDTDAEKDCLWSTGERTTAQEYFERVVVPMAREAGKEARFVRSQNKDGTELKGLEDYVSDYLEGKEKSLHIPVFGSNGGRLMQTCTDRWKLRAMRQELRRMGATTARTAIGIHANEWDRMKGNPLGMVDGWHTFQSGTTHRKTKQFKPTLWLTHYYPLVSLRLGRESIREKLDALGIPYLVSSECDFCPHKNLARWNDTTPETILRLSDLEARFNGEFFFTDERVPLLEALEIKGKKAALNPSLFAESAFGCENDVCGI